jgi:acetylglutamate kinase
MKKLIQKAEVLIEALPYIQKFRGQIVVVKFGGSAMEQRDRYDSILQDITFMECAGMLPVIVHGGGKAISRSLKKEGIKSKFVEGLRVTCEKSIKVIEQVFKSQVNPEIVDTLQKLGARAEGVDGEKIFTVTKKRAQDASGQAVDWGFVGEPGEVHTHKIKALLNRESIPVITPLGTGEDDGQIHNINADTAAAAVAKALQARKLVFLSDVPALLEDETDPSSVISTLKEPQVRELIKRGVISGGMLPKVNAAMEALQAGVNKVHIIDGRLQHSLLLEIFTDQGVGTEIIK